MFLREFGIKLQEKITNRTNEEKKIKKIFNSFNRDAKILDVGCGYGWGMDVLRKNGFKNVVGVEINNNIIENNLKNGFKCYSPDDLFKNFKNKKFEVILMSHIVEHFNPNDLRMFLNKYLSFLNENGSLIIATPLMTKFFYVDFDHIKPYDPTGMSMFFSEGSQLQFYSGFNMELENLYFRRSPFKLKNWRSLYIKKGPIPIIRRLPSLMNILLIIIFNMSGGFFGYTSGWVGQYKKLKK
jgi:SAM-dependent methyltransferase